jgi:hypothetical protein
MDITFASSPWLIVVCILAGALYAGFLYFGKRFFADAPGGWRWVLAILRGLLIAGLVLLLVNPLIRQYREVEQKPLLLIGQDVSTSIPKGMSAEEWSAYREGLAGLERELGDIFEVRKVGVGEALYETVPDTFADRISPVGKLLPYWSDLYAYQPVGAAIIFTDGIVNSGASPLYTPYTLKAPLHVVGLGDTTVYPDLLLQRVLYNEVVYLGDQVRIDVEMRADKLEQVRTQLVLEHREGGRWVRDEVRDIRMDRTSNFARESFRVRPDKSGQVEYRLRLFPVENERTTANNTQRFYLDVLDGRQRILVLAASPHPDIAAIRQWISDDRRYEVEIAYAEDGLVVDPEVDLVIFHQLPGRGFSPLNLIEELDRRKTPRFFVVGRQSAIAALNRSQDLVTVTGGSDQMNDAQALVNPGFKLFELDADSRQQLGQFPPLTTPFGTYQTGASAIPLFTQRISNIETDDPLLVLGETGGIRTGVLLGEGIWRWRLFDQLQHKNDKISREWLAKTIQFLSIVQDKAPFKVRPAKQLFAETEPITFDALLYNANFEPVTDPDVPLEIIDSAGTRYSYIFDKRDERYALDAGRFDPGRYRYTSSFEWNGKRFEDQGRFTIKEVSLELANLTADHRTLLQLASSNGGQFFTVEGINQLTETLKQSDRRKPVFISSTITFPFIHLKWAFFLLLILLTAEWVIRRVLGGL